jgi:ATP-dependent RNA helicase DeaD
MSLSDSVDTTPELTFRNFELSEPLQQAIEKSGYTHPTPIQAGTIPLLLAGRDVLGQAQTGTGKTAAFALPLLERIDVSIRKPQVLVLTPTRELAIQVAESFEKYAHHLRGLRVVPIYGGQDYQLQFRELDRGVQIIVGTPGRVMDHMRRGSLSLDTLRCLVLDEADEMLRMGFAEDVEWVLTQSPAERQIALFSATMPEPIRRIANQHLRNPAEITIRQRTATADTIRQRYVIAAAHRKEAALSRILEAEPIDGVIVFVKMKSTTEPLAEYLQSCGHRAVALNGDIAQKQRERIIDNLRAGKVNIVVATDVAARGLDVQRISHVINYDLPFDSEAYVHRIGRTGRAGRSGEAILFVHPRERRMLHRLENATRHRIEPMEVPSNRLINKQRMQKFHDRITEALAHPEMGTFASIIEQYRRKNESVTPEQVAAALAILLNGDQPLLLKEDAKSESFFDERGGSHDRGFREERRPHGRSDRFDRHDRVERGERREPSERGRSRERHEGPMETFRLEVGAAHAVKPGNIVGAIANEIGMDSSYIGRIEIYEEHTTVDLPEGMPAELFQVLKKVRVGGRKLDITRLNDARPAAGERRSAQSADTTESGETGTDNVKAKKKAKKKKKAAEATSAGV